MISFKKKLVLVFCIISIMFSNIVQGFNGYKGQLGTNKALGSPLLNNNFTYEQWNKWELVTFGIFLSNFLTPVLDDYESAFTSNSNLGSKGKGLEALKFGMGYDSAGEKALKSLLQYCINAQKSGGRPIHVVYSHYENGKVVKTDEPKVATLVDLFIRHKNSGSSLTEIEGIDGSSEILSEKTVSLANGSKVQTIDKAKLGKLVVSGSGEGQSEVVFDFSNSWDIQVLGAWVSSLANSEHGKEVSKKLNEMLKSNGNLPLVLDNFGNICVSDNGRNVVFIPASTNQYLTENRSYNLLNSVILNGKSFLDGGFRSMLSLSLNSSFGQTIRGGLSSLPLEDGKTLIFNDTTDAITKYYGNYSNDGVESKKGITLGDSLLDLTQSGLTSDGSRLGINIQIPGAENSKGWFGRAFDGDTQKLSQHIAMSVPVIATLNPTSNVAPVLDTLVTDKGEVKLFDNYAYKALSGNNHNFEDKVFNGLLDYFLKYVDGSMRNTNTVVEMESPANYRQKLREVNSSKSLTDLLYFKDGNRQSGIISNLMKSFIIGEGSYLFKLPKDVNNIIAQVSTYSDLVNSGIKTADGKPLTNSLTEPEISKGSTTDFPRFIKIWVKNSTMVNAMNVLSVKEGTHFEVWSRYVYLTYLNFYGIIGKDKHNFNTHLFSVSSDLLNVKPEELLNNSFLTEEEKQAKVLNDTMLLLDIDGGREYRRSWFANLVNDFLEGVYSDVVSDKNSNGFLTIDSYSDNPLTSWFISNYSKILIGLIGTFLVIIIITAVIKRRSILWVFINIVVCVNVLLFVPMLGEVVPYVANNVVQRLFSKDVTYYNMASSISNAKIEAEQNLKDKLENRVQGGLSTNEYIRLLNITQLDRSISAKFDISRKVVEDTTGIINEIQKLSTTRWLLPTLMRQFSADDGSANYVYQSVGDLYDNMSNIYWLYNYEDRLNYNTATSNTIQEGAGNDLSLSSKRTLYEGYVDTSMEATKNKYNGFENKTSNKQPYMEFTWNSVSRAKDDKDLVHTGFWLLDGLSVPDANGNFKDYINNISIDPNYLIGLSDKLEKSSHLYNAMEGAKAEYGFLWTTESPLYYFYTVIKDTFESGKSVGGFAGDLQGFYDESETVGREVRNSFLHYRDTGYIRDVLDLEELFTNVIPYMYSVYMIADETLGDLKITGNDLYEDNLKSWLYRSNWVIKLMENSVLTKPDTVKGTDGNKYKIENPLLPSSYPVERDMIFSEAEMYSKGLTEVDLSLAELKMVEINKKVANTWTLLLNYVNTPDITTETFYRQMAIDGLLIFNNEFNTDRGLFGASALYPTSLDLRNLSFDSIMKMILISTTRNGSLVYGNAMENVLANGSLVSGVLLLAISWLSVSLIPFIRNLLLALIFYLGFFLLVANLIGKQKKTIIIGFLGTNLIFLASTLVYYGMFSLVLNVSSADSVLMSGNTVVNVGSPDIAFLILLMVSSAYAIAIGVLFGFVFKNAYTLGGTAIINGLSSFGSTVKKGFNRVVGKEEKSSKSSNSSGNNTKNTSSTVTQEEPKTKGSKDNKDNDKESISSWNTKPTQVKSKTTSKNPQKENYLDKEIEKGKQKTTKPD